MRLVGDGVFHLARREVALAVFLRAADEARHVDRVGTAERIMEAHEAAAAFDERVERRPSSASVM